MKYLDYRMPREFTIVLWGDTHIGARACDYDTINAIVDRISEDGVYGIHMGDVAEAIDVNDRRFDPRSTEYEGGDLSLPVAQYDKFEELVKPIRDSMLLVLEGNHDAKLGKEVGDFVQSKCMRLGIDYGTYSCKADFQCAGGGGFRAFLWHGHGSVNSRMDVPELRKASERRSIMRKLRDQASDCDVMAMGHIHKLYAFQPEPETKEMTVNGEGRISTEHLPAMEFEDGSRYVPPNSRYYCATGSTLSSRGDGYSTYSERAGYTPQPTGWVELHYDSGSVSVEAIEYGG